MAQGGAPSRDKAEYTVWKRARNQRINQTLTYCLVYVKTKQKNFFLFIVQSNVKFGILTSQ